MRAEPKVRRRRGIALARPIGAALLLALLGIATWGVIDEIDRQDMIRSVVIDPQAVARRLADRVPDLRACRAAGSRTDLDTLMHALAAVETLATSRLQRTVETLIVRAARLLGREPPDYSIGPAQIRISTARAAAQWARASGCDAIRTMDTAAIAADLITARGAHDWGVLILAMYAEETATPTTPLDRAGILCLAGAYNGQRLTPDAEAAIAAALYREFVYQVVQELRFRQSTSSPSATSPPPNVAVAATRWAMCFLPRTMSTAFSAIIIVGAFVLPLTSGRHD